MPLCGAGTLVGCLWHHCWAELRFTGELQHPQSAPSLLEHHVCTRQRAEPRFQQPDAHVWRGTVLEEAGCYCKVQGCWLSQLGLKKSAAIAAAATDPARHAPFTPASRRTQVAAVASCAQLLLHHVCGLVVFTQLDLCNPRTRRRAACIRATPRRSVRQKRWVQHRDGGSTCVISKAACGRRRGCGV